MSRAEGLQGEAMVARYLRETASALPPIAIAAASARST